VRVDATGADPAFNGPSLDGCPFIARNGKTFYMASNRPGGLGGIDVWVSTRASRDAPWGSPVNVGAPVNSAANDFCPTISRDGHLFYFVSNPAKGAPFCVDAAAETKASARSTSRWLSRSIASA
jgi:WD40-like Beta Propeller Repeat